MSRRRFQYGVFAVAMVSLLEGCKTPDPALDDTLSKLVWMKYSHVANLKELDVRGPQGTTRIAPVEPSGFWAVFDVCSLDVQGSALTGFNYVAANFFVDGGTVQYGSMNPGTVNTGFGGPRSALDPQVQGMMRDALALGPPTQFFPKQFYPNLRYRIAIFVSSNPPGYQGGTLTLKYAGHPTEVQDISPANPDFRPFFSYIASPSIAGNCP